MFYIWFKVLLTLNSLYFKCWTQKDLTDMTLPTAMSSSSYKPICCDHKQLLVEQHNYSDSNQQQHAFYTSQCTHQYNVHNTDHFDNYHHHHHHSTRCHNYHREGNHLSHAQQQSRHPQMYKHADYYRHHQKQHPQLRHHHSHPHSSGSRPPQPPAAMFWSHHAMMPRWGIGTIVVVVVVGDSGVGIVAAVVVSSYFLYHIVKLALLMIYCSRQSARLTQ